MKTIVSTALSIFTLAVFLQVQGVATEPENAIQTPPAPTSPELWNVWGQAELDGLVWTVQPVACAESSARQVCVEVRMQNPGAALATGSTLVRFQGVEGSPMARMQPAPNELEARNVVLQAGAGETATTVLAFALPEVVPSQLQVTLGGSELEPWTGQTLAAFSTWMLGQDNGELGLVF